MMNDKSLDHLIDVLYETVLNPALWREAVGLCGRYAGGVDAMLLTLEKRQHTPITSVLAATEFSLQSGADYTHHYMAIDPRLNMLRDTGVNDWRCCHHTYDQNFVNHNDFYQDFFIYHGARYTMASWVDDNEEDHTLLALFRAVGQKSFDNTQQLAAQRFSGHLQSSEKPVPADSRNLSSC